MAGRIEIVSASSQRMIGQRSTASVGELAPSVMALLSKVWDSIRAAKVKTLGINVFLYSPYRKESKAQTPGEVEIAAGVLVTNEIAAPAGLEVVSTPNGKAAHLQYLGDYGGLSAAHDELRAWCQLNDGGPTGTIWEVYGHHEEDPTKRRTDIYYLLR